MTTVESLKAERDKAQENYEAMVQRGIAADVITAHTTLVLADFALRRAIAKANFVEYRPPHAPHVRGSYNERTVDLDGMPEEQDVHAVCEVCQATFQRKCASGNVRAWIARFGVVHLHRDPLGHRPRKAAEEPG